MLLKVDGLFSSYQINDIALVRDYSENCLTKASEYYLNYSEGFIDQIEKYQKANNTNDFKIVAYVQKKIVI